MKKKIEIITLNKKNIRDFAKERNSLLKKSESEWVFFKDKDEVISKKLNNEIKKAIKSKDFDGYFVVRENYLFGKPAGKDRILRLGKRKSGKWVRAVHETWVISGNVGVLKNTLSHQINDNIYQIVDKLNKYTDIHAAENEKEGKRSSLIKILLYPAAKFVQSMILGRGFAMSVIQSFHSFLSWLKLWSLQKD